MRAKNQRTRLKRGLVQLCNNGEPITRGCFNMQIDEYEFEEEMTLSSLAELFSKLSEDVKEGQRLELRMPSLKAGVIELPLGEPVETGLEVSLRKQSVRLSITLSWALVEPMEEE